MTPSVARTAHDRYLATRHFGSLDGLRFICIAAVIWHHAPWWAGLRDSAVFVASGHVGVDFFFVLSGFLITTLLLREDAATGTIDLRGFYWRRVLRIVPVYFLVVSIAAFYAIVIRGRTDQLEILPYYYLFLSNFLAGEDIGFLTITWSLAVEEQYYLVWPILLLLLPRRWVVPVLVVLIAVNVAAALEAFRAIGIYPVDVGHLRLQISGATYAPILMGSLAAYALHRPAGFALLHPLGAFRGAALLWFAALLVALAGFPGALEGWPNLVVHMLMTLMLISLVIREDNALAPVLRLPPLVRVGQISYGIYLYHLFALAFMTKALDMLGITSNAVLLVSYGALSIAIADISFRTYEAWFLRLRGHRPGARRDSPPEKA